MPGKYLIIHHTGGTDAHPLADSSNFTFEQCDALHKARFNYKSTLGYYVGYHYYIEKNGEVKQARADHEPGAHTIDYNDNIGICLAGNFDATMPTVSQVRALRRLLAAKMTEHGIKRENIVPHRTFANKTCYGRNLSNTWAQDLVIPKVWKMKMMINTLNTPTMQYLNKVKERCDMVSTYWRDAFNGLLDIQWTYEVTHYNKEIPWEKDTKHEYRNYIPMKWSDFHLAPRANAHDGMVFAGADGTWDSPGLLGYSRHEQSLGVHAIGMVATDNQRTSRTQVGDGSQFCGTLAHEIGHMLYTRSGVTYGGNDKEKGRGDNTHYYDYVEKDMRKIADEINLDNLYGWVPENGVRFFHYQGEPTKKRAPLPFTWEPTVGKLYWTRNHQFFFEYTKEGWRALSEGEWEELRKTQRPGGWIAVTEANTIQDIVGLPTPDFEPTGIYGEVTGSKMRQWLLRMVGWKNDIPTKHLKVW